MIHQVNCEDFDYFCFEICKENMSGKCSSCKLPMFEQYIKWRDGE